MRPFFIALTILFLGACASTPGAPPRILAPHEMVRVNEIELHHTNHWNSLRCWDNRPVVCDGTGSTFDCSCPAGR